MWHHVGWFPKLVLIVVIKNTNLELDYGIIIKNVKNLLLLKCLQTIILNKLPNLCLKWLNKLSLLLSFQNSREDEELEAEKRFSSFSVKRLTHFLRRPTQKSFQSNLSLLFCHSWWRHRFCCPNKRKEGYLLQIIIWHKRYWSVFLCKETNTFFVKSPESYSFWTI